MAPFSHDKDKLNSQEGIWDIVLRPIKEQDLPAAVEVFNTQPEYLMISEGQDHVTLEMVKNDWRNSTNQPGQRYRGAFDSQGKLVAILADWIVNPNDGFPWIGLLLVRKEMSNKGLAGFILREWEEEVKMRGHYQARVGVEDTNTAGVIFWTSMGYKEIQRRDWERDLIKNVVIIMDKQLI